MFSRKKFLSISVGTGEEGADGKGGAVVSGRIGAVFGHGGVNVGSRASDKFEFENVRANFLVVTIKKFGFSTALLSALGLFFSDDKHVTTGIFTDNCFKAFFRLGGGTGGAINSTKSMPSSTSQYGTTSTDAPRTFLGTESELLCAVTEDRTLTQDRCK